MSSRAARNCRDHLAFIFILLVVGFCAVPAGGKNGPAGITVELSHEKPLWLHVTLRSGAKRTVTFPRDELPWSSRYSMIFRAARSNGRAIKMELPVEDPQARPTISLAAGESLTGDIDLHRVIGDLDHVVKQSGVRLFWTYESPVELHNPRWSRGWVFIPQQK